MAMNKKGQHTMGLPFGMIFAIFLIVVFVVIAFIAIRGFLDIGDSARVGMFWDDLQGAVDEALSEQFDESGFDIDLPSGIESVCFANLSNVISNPGAEYEAIRNYDVYEANVFLVPPEFAENMQWKFIEHLDLVKITEDDNPHCVDVGEGLRVKKDFYSKGVMIE